MLLLSKWLRATHSELLRLTGQRQTLTQQFEMKSYFILKIPHTHNMQQEVQGGVEC